MDPTWIPIVMFTGIFAVPVTAIITSYRLKMKKLELGIGEPENVKLSKNDKKIIEALVQENEELRRRLENVELIVSDADPVSLRGSGAKKELDI